jgi:glycosyltransferase involved in cell wall biosynthesis
MKAEFSVLMSIYYNTSKKHFVECLHSINYQKLKPAELIIVQDGKLSFDLMEVINADSIIDTKILINELNLGLPFSLNFGLSHCEYDIVFRMDADDICHENRFFIQYYEMLNDENLAVLGSNVDLIDSESNSIPKIKSVPLLDNQIRKMMFFKNPFNHPSVVFRKKFVLNMGGYSNLYLYEDWYLWIKLSTEKKYVFKNIDLNLLKYRIRSFNDRRGVKVLIAEYNFYKKLYSERYISLIFFLNIIVLKAIVRILPSFLYLNIKHKFDNLILK